MEYINYPNLLSHKKNHNKFYVKTRELFNDIMKGNLVLYSEIIKTLTNWLQDHILNEDKKYTDLLPPPWAGKNSIYLSSKTCCHIEKRMGDIYEELTGEKELVALYEEVF